MGCRFRRDSPVDPIVTQEAKLTASDAAAHGPKPSCRVLPNFLNLFTRKSRNQVAQKHLFFDGPR